MCKSNSVLQCVYIYIFLFNNTVILYIKEGPPPTIYPKLFSTDTHSIRRCLLSPDGAASLASPKAIPKPEAINRSS